MKRKGRDFLLGVVVATLAIMIFSGEESVADKEPDRVVDVTEYMSNRKDLNDSVVQLSGGISYIRYTDNGVAVTLDKCVSCYFKGSEANKTSSLRIGDTVCVKGVSTMNYDGMAELNNCSIK